MGVTEGVTVRVTEGVAEGNSAGVEISPDTLRILFPALSAKKSAPLKKAMP